MRTTLNLDDDVVAGLTAESRERGRSLSRVANDLMRAGLRAARDQEPLTAYEPPTFDSGPPGIDVTDVADALEVLDGAG